MSATFYHAKFVTMIAVLIVMGCVDAAFGFDISAYDDPVSHVRHYQEAGSGLGDCNDSGRIEDIDRETWLINVININGTALQWWQEMGITILCVHYKPEDIIDYPTYFDPPLPPINFMNARYPTNMFKYLEAQGAERRLEATQEGDHNYVDAHTCTGSWGCSTRVETHLGYQTLAIGPGDSTLQEFWRPRAWFDGWKGWNRREVIEWEPNNTDSNRTLGYVMPIVVRLVCDISPAPAYTTDSSVVAIFRWMRSHEETWSGLDTDSGRQVLYPKHRIRLNQFLDSTAMDTIILRIDPVEYTAARNWGADLDPDSEIVYISNAYDMTRDSAAGFQGRFDAYYATHTGRFSITFCDSGGYTFYLYSVEAFDDAYYRMFEAPPETIHTTEVMIGDAFCADLGQTEGQVGWYYDEIPDHLINSYVRVNKILLNHATSLPAFIMNGYAFWDNPASSPWHKLYARAQVEGVQIPVLMTEFYPMSGDSTNQPTGHSYDPFGSMYTSLSSDVAYTRFENATTLNGGPNQFRQCEKAVLSLQAALDYNIWGCPQDVIDFFAANDLNDSTHREISMPGRVRQIQFVHQYGTKHWMLVQAGGQGPRNFDRNDGYYACNRDPSPEEIRLLAWLSVGMDTDGLMWYWGMSNSTFWIDWSSGDAVVRTDSLFRTSGLLEWGTSAGVDSLDETDFCHEKSIYRTNRYYAAGKVSNDIRRIEVVLDSLVLERTYASRAFETNYGASSADWVQTDTLWHFERDSIYQGLVDPASYVYSIQSTGLWDSVNGEWNYDDDELDYVQVSRFKVGENAIPDDYWFLIVNRRALEDERRAIRLAIYNVGDPASPYLAHYLLADSLIVTESGWHHGFTTDRYIEVVLDPGEAELIHFFKGGCSECECDTSSRAHDLTICLNSTGWNRLRWDVVEDSVYGAPHCYYVYGASAANGNYEVIGCTTTNTYLDSAKVSKFFYDVRACWTLPGSQVNESNNSQFTKAKVISKKITKNENPSLSKATKIKTEPQVRRKARGQ